MTKKRLSLFLILFLCLTVSCTHMGLHYETIGSKYHDCGSFIHRVEIPARAVGFIFSVFPPTFKTYNDLQSNTEAERFDFSIYVNTKHQPEVTLTESICPVLNGNHEALAEFNYLGKTKVSSSRIEYNSGHCRYETQLPKSTFKTTTLALYHDSCETYEHRVKRGIYFDFGFSVFKKIVL